MRRKERFLGNVEELKDVILAMSIKVIQLNNQITQLEDFSNHNLCGSKNVGFVLFFVPSDKACILSTLICLYKGPLNPKDGLLF